MRSVTTLSRRSVLVMPLVLAACYNRKQIIEIAGQTMGTTYKVAAIDHDGRITEDQVRQAISRALSSVNSSMSNWDKTSEVSRLNAAAAGEITEMSSDLAVVMAAASDVHVASEGRFDTTLGPLIELWGFGATGAQDVPNAHAIAAAKLKSGHANTLELEGNAVRKSFADTQVYLAGIGKGFGADHVGRALEALGIQDYLVEIGGDIYAQGRNPDGFPWQIGIESPDPVAQAYLGVVGISGLGLASSGDYRNYKEVEGKRYSHLIDPATGRPVEHNTASATVLAENAMLADAWSTAMLVLGRERGMDIAAKHNIAVQFVERDHKANQMKFRTVKSSAFEALTA